jgi:purine-binding chemotaxis protein CheW
MTPRANGEAMGESRQLCTFFLGGAFYGIDVVRVQEVIRYQEMTRVPLAPPEVRGLINLRGQIVTAIDMRRRLGLPAAAEGTLPMNVVIRTNDGGVSLLVDEIGDVLDVSESAFERVPETVSRTAREFMRGVYKLERGLLLELDPEKTVMTSTAPAS